MGCACLSRSVRLVIARLVRSNFAYRNDKKIFMRVRLPQTIQIIYYALFICSLSMCLVRSGVVGEFLVRWRRELLPNLGNKFMNCIVTFRFPRSTLSPSDPSDDGRQKEIVIPECMQAVIEHFFKCCCTRRLLLFAFSIVCPWRHRMMKQNIFLLALSLLWVWTDHFLLTDMFT